MKKHMNHKNYTGKLISVKFKDRVIPIRGFVIDSNDDWTLMKYNPVDYIIDGYVIFRHKKIEGIYRDAEEKWKEKVIKLKGFRITKTERIPIIGLETILKHLTDNFGVFQVYKKSENICYLGRLISIDDEELVMDDLNPKGKWEGQMTFKPDKIRVIEFDTDYINSLKLVAATKKITNK